MENKSKRFLSLLLALVMVIGLMPVGHVHAEDTVMTLGEMVTEIEADATYVITLHGTQKALTTDSGRGDWGTETRALIDCGGIANATNMWTLESAEGGYKLKNGDSYLSISGNTGALGATGHVFEFTYLGDAGWTIKSVDSGNYFNDLGEFGSTIGGYTSDGTKFDIYTVVEKTMDEIDPWGKRFWTKVSVETETVKDAYEGLFEYAWDRNPSTIWHSNWQGTEDKLTGENTFTGIIDFTKVYTISQFSFTPRQTGNLSGVITQASLYVKAAEDAEWVAVAENVTFDVNRDKKDINFDAQEVRYVKFVAEQSNDGWVAVSEFDIDYIAPAVHEHSPAVAVKENEQDATCTEDGSYDSVVYCSECGEELSRETNTVKAPGHKPVTIPGKDATCTAPGRTDGAYCENCDANITIPEDIPPLGHNYENGSCTRCGEAEPAAPVVAEKIADISGEGSSVDTSEAAFDKSVGNAFDGNYDTFWATVESGTLEEDYLIADLGATYSISRVDYTKRLHETAGYNCTGNLLDYIIEVSVDGENWTEVAKGDTVDGTTEITFDAVNARYVKLTATKSYHWQEVNANKVMTVAELEVYGIAVEIHEHTPAEAVPENEKPATCTEDGSYDSVVYCSECGEELSRETHSVKALDHEYEVVEVVPPTCTKSGYTVYGCIRCDKTYKDDPTEPEHKFDEGFFREPTCSAMGCMVYTCELCGYEYEMEDTYVPAVDHTAADEPAKENEKPATCTEDGSYEAVYKCKFCDLEMKRETIPVKALDHEYEVVEVVPPTCTKSGYTVYGCIRCDKTYKDDPTEPEHKFDEGFFREPTCSAMGCMVYTCELCGYKYEEEGTYVPAVDHTAADEPAKENEKPATCTEDGSYEAVYKCKFCDLEMKRETISVKALGHNYENGFCTNCDEAAPTDPEKLTGITGTPSSTDTSEAAYDKSVGNAFDGDYNTFWATVPGGTLDEAYLIADLGAEYIVSQVDYTKRVYDGSYDCTGNLLDYVIEVSVDGENWTEVAKGDTVNGTTEITFEPVKAAYVRLTANKSYHWDAPQANTVMTVAELEVYGLPVGAIHTHVPGEPVPENENPATCTEDGSYDSVVYCSECGEEISRVPTTIDALGHDYVDGICTRCGDEEDGYIDPSDPWGKSKWVKVEVDSETIFDWKEGNFEYAWDGDLNTIWHSDWKNGNDVLTGENTISGTIDFTREYYINQFSFTPRQDDTSWENGSCVVLQASLYVKDADDTEWKCVAEHVEFEHNQQKKTFYFEEQNVRYVKFVAEKASQMGLTDSNGNPMGFVAVAEFDIDYVPAEECPHPKTEVRNAKAATCTEAGYTGDTYCVACNVMIEEGKVIDALGHKEVTVDGKPATCTEKGLTEGKKCSVCGVTTVEQKEIDALGHEFVNGDCSRCDEVLKSSFEDIFAGDYYFDAVEWAVEEKITAGATPTTFDPNGELQRAQFVTFLWRAAGEPEPKTAVNPFTDVTGDDFYYKAVLWAVENEITAGTSATTFSPNGVTNRAQAVTFLWRYLNKPDATATNSFKDVVDGEWYEAPINWAVGAEVTQGISADEFGINNNCIRAQAVTFLFRALVD